MDRKVSIMLVPNRCSSVPTPGQRHLVLVFQTWGRPAHSEPVFGIVSTASGFVSAGSWTVGFVFSLEKYQGRVKKCLLTNKNEPTRGVRALMNREIAT